MYWGVWDRHNPIVSLVTIFRSMGRRFKMIDFFLVILKSFDPISFLVKFGVVRYTMNGEIIRFGDVGHVPDIYLRKVDCFENNFRSWACRGVDLSGIIGIIGLLYEEITYIHPHRLKVMEYIFV